MSKSSTVKNDVIWSSGTEMGWVEREGHFVGIQTGSEFVAAENLDLDHLGAKHFANCSASGKCAGPFPPSFSHCPDCAEALVSMFSDNVALWSYPGGDGDGLLNSEAVTIKAVSEPVLDRYCVPEACELTLVVAGSPRRLLAVDRVNSIIYVFSRHTKAWRTHALKKQFDAELPKYSWSVLAFDGGVAVPGHDGPIIATLNSSGTKFDVTAPGIKISRVVSGAAEIDKNILFLCLDATAGYFICSFDIVKKKWSGKIPVVGSPRSVGCRDESFAAPVRKAKNLFWAGAQGYVAIRSVESEFEAQWRSWSTEFKPERQVRPIWTQQSLWQFGVTGRTPSFERLSFRGSTARNEVHSTHLTAGECSFTTGMKLYTTPWDEGTAHTMGSGDSFQMPICGISGLAALVADCGFDPNNCRTSPSELLTEGAATRPARLVIQKVGGETLDLKHTIKLGHVLQLQAIIFDDHLLIYDNVFSSLVAWEIIK